MATIPWPAELPCQPEQGSWQETPQPNVARFPPEVGPPILRRRGTARTVQASATFVFTRDEYVTFRDWYLNDLKGGSLRFALAHPVTAELAEWTFEADPQMSAMTNRKVRVSVQLRMLP